jgi:NADP-dependent 3-hydroxy acid dehydrogenase YdfG
MLLHQKNAVIYGAGAIGGAVATAFAREGANVFLASRTLATVEALAGDISAAGGTAEAAQVDAFDEGAVDRHIEEVVRKAGSIDILSMPSAWTTSRGRHSWKWRSMISSGRFSRPRRHNS